MTPVQTDRTCYVCKKVFCCEQCREQHEVKKHSKRRSNCPFCASQKLPLKSIEDKALFCHIVITHLPLYCRLCGAIFKEGKDLESFGACKWWNSRRRHSLVSEPKLGTPPFVTEGKESSQGNGNFASLTSPPELYRNTSTPMIDGQKTSLNFKTPNVPNFSLKTPQTNSISLEKNLTRSDLQSTKSKCDNSESNYMSCPSAVHDSNKDTPFRSLPSTRGTKDELPRGNSRTLGIMKKEESNNTDECYADNNYVVDMELTNVENEMLPDSQSLETCQVEKKSESLKKVRFSDEYENRTGRSSTGMSSVTENEEYYEACDTLSDMKQSLEKSQIKIYEDNAKNQEKENRSPDKVNANGSQQSSSSSRVVMMVIVENDSSLSTSDLINSGLKKLERITSSTNLSISSCNTPGSSTSAISVDSYYSASSHTNFLPQNESDSPAGKASNTSSSSANDSNNSGGILSAFASAVRTVMKNLSGVGSPKDVNKEQESPRVDVDSRPSTSSTFHPLSSFASSLSQRSAKRPRDAPENAPVRQSDSAVHPVEVRSPVAKRHRGWYSAIKAREPIARMRNRRQLTSPRGVSSETQVFHQGSLSVGDTVLPLPDRAHQSTQTE
ncbi:uncharacterized protein LOC143428997 [Xylocopa sonorina]|uniref:uncharacterized protein LOC143428997 n=1 Tax=Xylocopa sonorina TaxID=1818115 RepID=UPI00403AC716